MKKLISLVLALTMVLSFIPVFASAGAEKKDVYPLIILPGINHSVSYLANEDGTPYLNSQGQEISGGVVLIDTDGLVGKAVKKLLLPLLSSLLLQCDCGISDAAYDLVSDIFSIQKCDNEGVQINNLVTKTYNYPVSDMDKETKKWFYQMIPIENVTEKIGEDNVYLYTFPLIGDPMESAEHLKDYIDMVKEQKNVDKVNIATVSLGGTILTAYADIIDNDWSDVDQIINVVSCLNGTDLFADFFERSWNLSADFLYRDYLRMIMDQSNGSKTLGCIINMALRIFSKDTVYSILTGAFSAVLDTLILNDPEFWAMLPKERYDTLAERYLTGSEHAVLRKKTDTFQQARINLESNLQAAADQGVVINSICGTDLSFTYGDYNYLGIVASSATCNSDGIVPVYSTSLGATTVPAGQVFSEDYLNTHDAKYISDFKSIDASTCLFKDNVWFFQEQHHEVGRNDAVMELLSRIVTGDITDVYSDPQFPQFMGTRYTREFIRWLYPEAKEVMANEEGKYTQEQIDDVTNAYNYAKGVLSDYSLNSSNQDKIDDARNVLNDALVRAGRRKQTEPAKEDSFEKYAVALDDFIFSIFKDNGYLDWTRFGKITYWFISLFKK